MIKKALLLTDIHIPFECPNSIRKAFEVGKKFNPDTIVLGGDIIDFHSISRFQKNPKERDLVHEIERTRMFLSAVRKKFPKARIIYKLGNHELRLSHYLWNKAEEFAGLGELELPNLLHFTKYGVEFVPDDKVVKLGKLNFVHGHETGISICSVYPARSLLLCSNVNSIAGHCHRPSSCVKRTLNGQLIKTYTVGCLCNLRPDYRLYNDWVNGIGLVEVSANGDFNVELKSF